MRAMNATIVSTADTPLGQFAEALASEQPTPGGGAAAAVAATLAASLTAMVVRLSLDRPRYADHADLHAEALAASDAARRRLLDLADEDIRAYATYLAARSMPRETEAEQEARAQATRAAARVATEVPLAIVQACHSQIGLVERLAGRTNQNAASDLEVAALLLEAAARAAAANVTINLGAVGDDGFAAAVSAELSQRLQQVQRLADRARERIAQG
jgi:glutamate formiminotransferase/formiminotetrahydrofolate cyclodeaminase